MAEDNVVLVGNKPVMNYILSVNTMAMQGKDEILLKARGKAISRAVDIEEMSLNRFLSSWKLGEIKLGTETKEVSEIKRRDRNTGEITTIKLDGPRTLNISTIEIHLVKQKEAKGPKE